MDKFAQQVCYASSSDPSFLLPVLGLQTTDSIVVKKSGRKGNRHSSDNRFSENCK